MVLNTIIEPIEKELELFENKLLSTTRKEGFFIDDISAHVFNNQGKRIRPIITLLSASLVGEINEKTIRSAIILELLHTASLIHDDVLDQSDLRRGVETVSTKWGNNSAILFGDYLYSKCLELIETKEDFNLIPIYAKVGRDLPLGELMQKDISEKLDYSVDSYFSIINKKTASLLQASAEVGVMTTNTNSEHLDSLSQFGLNLGLAFQIKDDILDFNNQNTGKPIGNDIREKKITLPLIYFLNDQSEEKRKEILELIKKDDKTDEEAQGLIDVVSSGVYLDMAQKKVEKYSNISKEHLSHLPDSKHKESLLELADYLLNRNR